MFSKATQEKLKLPSLCLPFMVQRLSKCITSFVRTPLKTLNICTEGHLNRSNVMAKLLRIQGFSSCSSLSLCLFSCLDYYFTRFIYMSFFYLLPELHSSLPPPSCVLLFCLAASPHWSLYRSWSEFVMVMIIVSPLQRGISQRSGLYFLSNSPKLFHSRCCLLISIMFLLIYLFIFPFLALFCL